MRVRSAEFVRSAFGSQDFLRDREREVAFVGRSNVGKSTLLNRLIGRKKLARTSRTPGRTRAVNYFLIDGSYFVDLPGYGYAKAGKQERKQWAKVVDLYFEQAASRVLVVQLVDGKVGATPLDVQAFGFLTSLGVPIVLVATKIDKLKRAQRARSLAGIRATLDLPHEMEIDVVSAKTGEGLDALWRRILHAEQ